MSVPCPECYSPNSRATPLHGAVDCLTHHTQYICSTCGRMICIETGIAGKRRARSLMPFKSLTEAILYLRVAEILLNNRCAIYEFIDRRGTARYRIMENDQAFEDYLRKNPQSRCKQKKPIYCSTASRPVKPGQIRRLTYTEVVQYLSEKNP
jgi:hypothetical protein